MWIIDLIIGLAAAGLAFAWLWYRRIAPELTSLKKAQAELAEQTQRWNAERQQAQQEIEQTQARLAAMEADVQRQLQQAAEQAERLLKEADLEAKENAFRIRAEAERDNRDKRMELQRLERRLTQKEETLERRLESAEQLKRTLEAQREEAERLVAERNALADAVRQELQRVAGLSQEEARQLFLRQVEEESRHEASQLIRTIEEEARQEGERRARSIIIDAIQRCAVDQVTETTVSVVPLPGDEMKGRIIGREGRNIRAFEVTTGVDLVIDDTPEAVVLSCFDPIRREVARLALSALIADGRIHPARIEEAVEKAREEVDKAIWEAGETAILDTGITGLAPELIKLLGKLRYRTSFGQNMLAHSVEVSLLAGMLAAELNVNVPLAKRAGLLHDIGKALDHEEDAPHAVLTMDVLRRYGEPEDVVVAAGAHHRDIDPSNSSAVMEALLVMVADSLSAARPGARREMLETYVKRLKHLERIGESFAGVESTFAVQAGREVRLIVRPDQVDDLGAQKLARDIAKRIEDEMEYPGQIRVTVVRETRAVEYAR